VKSQKPIAAPGINARLSLNTNSYSVILTSFLGWILIFILQKAGKNQKRGKLFGGILSIVFFLNDTKIHRLPLVIREGCIRKKLEFQ
jgi:hypothetical protein